MKNNADAKLPMGLRTLFVLVCIALMTLTTSGCGQKGPLYLPDEQEEFTQA
jgi:predicted small lipoprotein YifL